MTNTYETVLLQCSDCGCEFEFTQEEQEFYGEKGFSSPKRCAPCRAQNRQRKNNSRGGFRPKIRHDVTCSACGIQTTVPFKPSQDKPVYCPDCYKKGKEEQF